MAKKVVHMVHSDGGEYPFESEWIPCEGPVERYDDPKTTSSWGSVTCKRCLKSRETGLQYLGKSRKFLGSMTNVQNIPKTCPACSGTGGIHQNCILR